MDEATPSPKEEDAVTRFTVDLGEIELTDEEVSTLQNQITKLAVETVQQKRSDSTDENASGSEGVSRRRRGPFVKIIFVRAIHR
jgi:hypothetical protein